MNGFDKFERTWDLALYGVLICSFLFFLSFLIRAVYSFLHAFQSFPQETLFLIGDVILLILILSAASWRWLALRALAKKNPSLRNRPKDERERYAWLKAFRPAFYVLLMVPVLGKIVTLFCGGLYEVPSPSLLSLSAALMTVVGAFLYHKRDICHE